ncbi:MAG TPA: hypothetical protein VET89_07645 [Stellaceae bacterium]|nr:hypothetical protein [Stellaceae bacterium]
MEQQVGCAAFFKLIRDEAGPIVEPPAKIGSRQPPEYPVAKVEVDPVNPVPARDQRPAQPLEEERLRALQEQERARDQTTFA